MMKSMKLTELIAKYQRHADCEYMKHGRATNTAGNIARACRYLLEVQVRGARLLDREPTGTEELAADLPQLDLLAQDLPGAGGEPVRRLAEAEVESLDRDDVRDFLDHLLTKINRAGQTWTLTHVNKQRQLVLQMIDWAESERLLSAEVSHELKRCPPLKASKTKARRSKRVPAAPEAVVREVISSLRSEPRPRRADHRRKRLLLAIALELMWETGMRPIELVVLRRCDIKRDQLNGEWAYHAPEWKTEHVSDKPRIIGLSQRAHDLIDEAVFAASADDNQARLGYAVEFDDTARLFGWRAAHPYHARSAFYEALQRALDRAGLSSISLLQLRHSFATRAVRVSVEGARVQLGHNKLSTTSLYLDDTAEARIELLDGLASRDHPNPPPPAPPRKTGTDDQAPPHQLRLVRD